MFPTGHFYNADSCDDCVYKAADCGCEPSMEYFACLTKHCSASNSTAFGDKCAQHSSDCSGQLDINCRGPATSCKSKYFQLPEGGIGLSLDLNHTEDDAYCGPFGKCIGKIHMKVNVHNFPKLTKTVEPVAPVGLMAPAPAAVTAAAPAPVATGPAPAGMAPKYETAADVWLECGLPKVSHADADVRRPQNFIMCEAKVEGLTAACDIPMDISLKAAKDTNGYCLLKEKSTGKRLTQPAYTKISNDHESPEKEVVAEPAIVHADDDIKLPWMEDKEARQASRAAETKEKPAPVKAVKETPKAPPTPEKAIKKMHDSDDGELPWMEGK
jgi:hypothetical protein